MNRWFWTGAVLLLTALPAGMLAQASGGSRPPVRQHLALCSKCVDPTITAISGVGSANAVAVAKVTRQDAAGWCENWEPQTNRETCIRAQLEQFGSNYRAQADCTTGKITAIDGNTYLLAGVWDNSDIGGGRSKWRDSSGAVVGRDNASNGLAISQQWETLCPGPIKPSALAAARNAALQANAPPRVASPTRAAPANPPICGGKPNCAEVNSFAASIVDFRTSSAGRDKVLTATIHFKNKNAQPLVLGYVFDSGVGMDDQGNRYGIWTPASVRGIGLISGNQVDPKFVLNPGEGADGRFEFVWRATGGAVLGTTYNLDLVIREIVPLAGNQYQLGREHSIRFDALTGPAPAAAPVSSVPTSSPVAATNAGPVAPVADAAAPQAQSAPPAPLPDACGGRPRCYSTGVFAAEVTNVSSVQANPRAHHVLKFNVRFRNATNQPIILAYKSGTNAATDNYGHPYYWGRAGTHDTSAQGIGILTGRGVGSSFALNPGEARAATFTVVRFNPTPPLGNAFTYDVVIAQLEVLPNGQQVRTVREHSLNFQNLTATGPVANTESISEAAQKIGDLFRRKK